MTLWAALLLIGFCGALWFLGSVIVANYINMTEEQRGSSNEWFDLGWPQIAAVLTWPIAMPLALPYKGARVLGRRLYTKVHYAELVQKELAREEKDTPPPPSYGNAGYPGQGRINITLKSNNSPQYVVTSPVSVSKGSGANYTLPTPIRDVDSLEVRVS